MQRIPGTLIGQTSQQLSLPLLSIHTVSHPQMRCDAQHPSCDASSCEVSAACASPPVPDALMCEATRKTREMIMKLSLSLSLFVTFFQRRPLEPTCTQEIIRSAARLNKTVHREVMNPHLSSSSCAWNQDRQLLKHLSKHAHWCSRIFPSHRKLMVPRLKPHVDGILEGYQIVRQGVCEAEQQQDAKNYHVELGERHRFQKKISSSCQHHCHVQQCAQKPHTSLTFEVSAWRVVVSGAQTASNKNCAISTRSKLPHSAAADSRCPRCQCCSPTDQAPDFGCACLHVTLKA